MFWCSGMVEVVMPMTPVQVPLVILFQVWSCCALSAVRHLEAGAPILSWIPGRLYTSLGYHLCGYQAWIPPIRTAPEFLRIEPIEELW